MTYRKDRLAVKGNYSYYLTVNQQIQNFLFTKISIKHSIIKKSILGNQIKDYACHFCLVNSYKEVVGVLMH